MLFGKAVHAVRDDYGSVMFERKSFISALGKPRAERIFSEMGRVLAFLGDDGAEALIEQGKEYVLCNFILSNKDTSDELREYATAWVTAYELLADK